MFAIGLIAYAAIGLIFGWLWYFKHVRIGAEKGEYLFYLLLVLLWPFPLSTEILFKIRKIKNG